MTDRDASLSPGAVVVPTLSDADPPIAEPESDMGDVVVRPIDESGCTPWDGEVVRAEFEVPGAADASGGDYFRLPFPNDIRRNDDGTIDLSGFPAQTAIAQQFVDAANGRLDGFGNYQTVTLRFTGVLDYASLSERVVLLDVTAPALTEPLGRTFSYDAGEGRTVCHDSVSIRVPDGRPLEAGHTYVAGVRSGVVDEAGRKVRTTQHFEALLADNVPEDPALARAHAAYAPFRSYLEAAGESAGDWLTAAVFTTGDPTLDMRQLAERVARTAAPTATEWTRCGSEPSPCLDVEEERDCGPENAAYEEFHALVRIPVFQQGDAPYLQSGGAIDPNDVVREEDICVALAVPTAEAPADGFPLLVFGHGAGGSFRSAMAPAVAERFALATDDAGNPLPVAVLGFDQVAHGPRRGDGPGSSLDPELVLFNLLNPDSVRGTTLQAGADVISIGRVAKALGAGSSLEVAFDTEHLVYWGHSQGGSQGAIALPFTDDFVGSVFSGTGAGIVHALLERIQPTEIPIAVRDSVSDPGADDELVRGGVYHPTLSILQLWVDAVDPLHFAKHLARNPMPDRRPQHLFAPYGKGDTYAPRTNLQNFIIQAGLQGAAAPPSADPPDDLGPELPVPLSGNLGWMTESFTAGFRQYGPEPGEDGHFVAFSDPTAQEDVVRFLVQTAYGGLPEIGAP